MTERIELAEGRAVLHLGDCLGVLKNLPAGSISAVVTDPPYGTDAPADGYGRRGLGGPSKRIAGDGDLSLFSLAMQELPRLLPANAWVVAFCSPKRHAETAAICEQSGLPVVGECVWDKRIPGLGGGLRYQHETILLCAKGEPKGHGPLFSVLSHLAVRGGTGHPHEKPVTLMCALLKYACRKDSVVLDLFMGSGTTGVACMRAGRRFIGCEIDPGYFEVARRRIEGVTSDGPLFAAAQGSLLEGPE